MKGIVRRVQNMPYTSCGVIRVEGFIEDLEPGLLQTAPQYSWGEVGKMDLPRTEGAGNANFRAEFLKGPQTQPLAENLDLRGPRQHVVRHTDQENSVHP